MKNFEKLVIAVVGAGLIFVGADKVTCTGAEAKIDASGATYCTSSFEVGVFSGDEIAIPDDATYAKVSMSRDGWIDQGEGVDVVSVVADIIVGKEIYKNACGFTTDGGNRFDHGEISPESSNHCPLPEGKDRKIKVSIDAKEDLQSKVSVTFE